MRFVEYACGSVARLLLSSAWLGVGHGESSAMLLRSCGE